MAGASFHACKLPDPATKRTQFPGASVRATRPYLQGSWVVGPPSHQFQAPTQQWSAAIPAGQDVRRQMARTMQKFEKQQ